MKINKLVIVFFLTTSAVCYSQNYLFVNDKQYSSTSEWSFESGSRDFGRVNLVVAENSNQGFFSVSISTFYNDNIKFKGLLYIFLEEGHTIKLERIVSEDKYDDVISAVYFLSENNIKMLTKFNILEIRYSLSKSYIYGGKEITNHTALNKRSSLDLIGNYLDRPFVNESQEERMKRQNSFKKVLEYYTTADQVRFLFTSY